MASLCEPGNKVSGFVMTLEVRLPLEIRITIIELKQQTLHMRPKNYRYGGPIF